MPRTVDPERLARRRALILGAAYRQFAVLGYERTTTASICREAGISSGTFFHYFPTKLDALVMLLTSQAQSAERHLDRVSRMDHGLSAILDHVREVERERTTEHSAGFANAVAGVAHLPEVAAAIRMDADRVRAFLRARLGEATTAGEVRTDVPSAVLAQWTQWLLDGATRSPLGLVPPQGTLIEAVRDLLRTH